jgi:hypothetical protein
VNQKVCWNILASLLEISPLNCVAEVHYQFFGFRLHKDKAIPLQAWTGS